MKMTIKYTLYTAFALVSLCSCAKENIPEEQPGQTGDAIVLSCAVSGAHASLDAGTKATVDYKGILESVTELPDGNNLEVGLVRVDRTRKDLVKYGEEPDQGLVFRAGMPGLDSFTSEMLGSYSYGDDNPHYYFTKGELEGTHSGGYRKIKDFTNAQYYRTNSDIVQYVSWFPFGTVNGNASADHADDPFTVTEDLDLKTDVLYTGIASESMDRDYQDIITYQHALCQFKIYVYRMINLKETGKDEHGVPIYKDDNVWGKLSDVIAKNVPVSLDIQLPDDITYDYDNRADFSLKGALPNAFIDNGTYSYDVEINGVFYVSDETLAGDPEPDVHGVVFPTGLDHKKMVACYLSAPPKDGLLELDVTATAATSEKTITIANEFKAGYAYDVVLCFSDHGIVNSEISIGKWDSSVEIKTDVNAEMFYDLSRYGTANSYIVSSSNLSYAFNGTVKGCGNTLNGASIVGLSDADVTLPSDSYVDILYCEPEGLLNLRSNMLVDGSVLFNVPGYPEDQNPHPGTPDYRLYQKGNALIAVRNGQGGEILWSWHIWVTDRPLVIGNNNGYSIMDRNLGALSSPKTKALIQSATVNEVDGWDENYYGYYYQWGRKDPIIPGWTVTGALNELASIEDAVKNPGKFYGYTYPVQGFDWIDPAKNTNVDKFALWGFKQNQDFVKTIYDPCPPGYRVPELNTWTQKTGVDFHTFMDPDFSATNKIAVFNINGVYTWYPAAGWIDADDQPQIPGAPVGVKHSRDSELEGAIPDNRDAYCYVAELHENTGTPGKYGGNVFNGADVAGQVYRLNNADACPVRCISTASQSIVKDLCKAQTSNCYIIPDSGTYKFRADVRGNGTQKVTTSAGSYQVLETPVNIDHGSIHHVAVLWWQGDLSGQTGTSSAYGGSNGAGTDCPIKFVRSEGYALPKNPARGSADFTDQDIAVIDDQGYVKFHVDEERYCHGNAIIAAFDSDNKILWSWHMWLTDEVSKVKFGPRTVDDHTYIYYCMDRNLGATYCPTDEEITGKSFGDNAAAKRLGTIGFYYQWGRKDPIQGPASYNSNTGTGSSRWYLRDVNNGYAWTAKDNIQTASAVQTRSDAVAVPATFLTNTSTTGRINWNLFAWGTTGETYNRYTAMWGYPSGTTNATYDPRMTKTMNDPCPPGYYMPPHYFFAAGHLANSGNDQSQITTTYNSGDTNGLFATPGTTWTVGSPIWFPFAGYRAVASGNITNLGSQGAYHSGLDWGSNNIRVFRLENGGGGQLQLAPGTGATVRCRAY